MPILNQIKNDILSLKVVINSLSGKYAKVIADERQLKGQEIENKLQQARPKQTG